MLSGGDYTAPPDSRRAEADKARPTAAGCAAAGPFIFGRASELHEQAGVPERAVEPEGATGPGVELAVWLSAGRWEDPAGYLVREHVEDVAAADRDGDVLHGLVRQIEVRGELRREELARVIVVVPICPVVVLVHRRLERTHPIVEVQVDPAVRGVVLDVDDTVVVDDQRIVGGHARDVVVVSHLTAQATTEEVERPRSYQVQSLGPGVEPIGEILHLAAGANSSEVRKLRDIRRYHVELLRERDAVADHDPIHVHGPAPLLGESQDDTACEIGRLLGSDRLSSVVLGDGARDGEGADLHVVRRAREERRTDRLDVPLPRSGRVEAGAGRRPERHPVRGLDTSLYLAERRVAEGAVVLVASRAAERQPLEA